MQPRHSWKWLSPRFVTRHLRRGVDVTPQSRPCIALEPLDNRVLLSDTPHGDGHIEGGEIQVLTQLLKGGIEVSQDQFALLKLVGTLKIADSKIQSLQVLNKTSPLLFQIDDVLFKLGEDAIAGKINDSKVTDAANKLEYLQVKLKDVIVSSYGAAASSKLFGGVLESLKFNVQSLVGSLVQIEGTGDATQTLKVEFLKLAGDFLKIDDLLIKGELDFLKLSSPGLNLSDFQSKIESIFSKVNEAIIKLDGVESTLLPAVEAYKNDVFGLLGSLEDDGGFDGGITLTDGTDDIIT